MPAPDPTTGLVGLARALRAAGVDVGTGAVLAAVEAVAAVDARRRDEVYWALRVSLCRSVEDIRRFDVVFADWAGGGGAADRAGRRRTAGRHAAMVPVGEERPPGAGEEADRGAPALRTRASRAEVLRDRDVASLTDAERAELHSLLAAFRLPGALRRTRRTRSWHGGQVDRRRTVRALLAAGGEPAPLRHRAPRLRPRRVVLLVDVSGSMSSYADVLLRFAHAARRRAAAPTEVFTLGTRLTRVTRQMGLRDPDAALRAVGAAVPDWRGGTRLGPLLKAFLDGWGQRGMARGAVVVVLSDGWERGGAALLGSQMARLSRLAHRVVWANPRKGRPGYEPLAAGMAAALPHCDAFVAGHSLGALERLARVVADAAAGDPLPAWGVGADA